MYNAMVIVFNNAFRNSVIETDSDCFFSLGRDCVEVLQDLQGRLSQVEHLRDLIFNFKIKDLICLCDISFIAPGVRLEDIIGHKLLETIITAVDEYIRST